RTTPAQPTTTRTRARDGSTDSPVRPTPPRAGRTARGPAATRTRTPVPRPPASARVRGDTRDAPRQYRAGMAVLAPPVQIRRPRIGLAPSAWLLPAALAALALALRIPVATAVLGLVGFGVLHNVLELRYVTGRFDTILAGPFLGLLAVLITGV